MHCQLIFFVTLLGGFAPPAARANLRSVFHSIGLRNTAEKLHFYLELTATMYDLTQIEVIMLTSFMDVTHEKHTNNRITKSHLCRIIVEGINE